MYTDNMLTLTLDKSRFEAALRRAGYQTASQLAAALAELDDSTRALSAAKTLKLVRGEKAATLAEQRAFARAYGREIADLFSEGKAKPLLGLLYEENSLQIRVSRPLSRAAVSRWHSQGVLPERLLQLAKLLDERPGYLLDSDSRAYLEKLLES